MDNVTEEMQRLINEKETELINDKDYPLNKLKDNELPKISKEEKNKLLTELHKDADILPLCDDDNELNLNISPSQLEKIKKLSLEKQRSIVRQLKANYAHKNNSSIMNNKAIKSITKELGLDESTLSISELNMLRENTHKTDNDIDYSVDDNSTDCTIPKKTKLSLSDMPVDFE